MRSGGHIVSPVFHGAHRAHKGIMNMERKGFDLPIFHIRLYRYSTDIDIDRKYRYRYDFFCSRQSHYIVQVGLKLVMILLQAPNSAWNYRCLMPCPAMLYNILKGTLEDRCYFTLLYRRRHRLREGKCHDQFTQVKDLNQLSDSKLSLSDVFLFPLDDS